MMSCLFSMRPFWFTLALNAFSLTGAIIVFFFREEMKEGFATHKWFMSHNDSRGKSVLTWKMQKCFTSDSLPGSDGWQWNFIFEFFYLSFIHYSVKKWTPCSCWLTLQLDCVNIQYMLMHLLELSWQKKLYLPPQTGAQVKNKNGQRRKPGL